MSAGAAHACSCPDCDPVADAPIIVGGTITGWREAMPTYNPQQASFAPIWVDVAVDTVYRGSTAAAITVLDTGSYFEDGGEPAWQGASGSCGAFDADPTGAYIVTALVPRPDGAYEGGRLRLIYIGEASHGPDFDAAVARLGATSPAPPASGSAPPETPQRGPSPLLLLGVIVASAGLLAMVMILCFSARDD